MRISDWSSDVCSSDLMAGTEICRPLRDLRNVLQQGMVGQSAAAAVRALLDSVSDAPGTARTGGSSLLPGNSKASTSESIDGVGVNAGPNKDNAVQEQKAGGLGIEFDQVSFSYPGGRGATHKGLSFSIQPGERVGIVGPRRAGTSSLVRLLLTPHAPPPGPT